MGQKIAGIKLISGQVIRGMTLIRMVMTLPTLTSFKGQHCWEVRTESGELKIVSSSILKRYTVTKEYCGAEISATNHVLGHYKHSAKKRGYNFELSREEFVALINSDCAYCGQKPSQHYTYRRDGKGIKHNGIDRVDNTKGYTLNNCMPACATCNYAKRDLTITEYCNWLDNMADFVLAKRTKQKETK